MKNKLILPANHEKLMRENDFIVSKTDLAGRITYGNDIFVEFSGYSEQDLIGAQHNIIRHPDMPRGVFKFLWDTVQTGNEVFAYVKNMAKDGSFYWVFANVTADKDANGKVIGYLSVRRAPKREAVKAAAGLYALMLEAERKAGPRDACAASLELLAGILKQNGTSYEEFVLSL